MLVAVELGQDFAEEKQDKREQDRLKHKVDHGAGYHKNLRKGIVEQKHYRHIDKIVGDKDCGEQTLRLFEQARHCRALVFVLDIVDVALRKGEERCF